MNRGFQVCNLVESLSHKTCIEDCYSTFISTYNSHCASYIPPRKQLGKTRTPWMTPEIRKLSRRKFRLLISIKISNGTETNNIERYKFLCKQIERETRAAIVNYEIQLALKAKSDPKLIYSYVNRRVPVDSVSALHDQYGQLATDKKEISEILNNYFASVFTDPSSPSSFPEFLPRQVAKPMSYDLDQVLAESVLRSKLENLNVNKSSGTDQLHPYVLKSCAKSLAAPLALIFKRSL